MYLTDHPCSLHYNKWRCLFFRAFGVTSIKVWTIQGLKSDYWDENMFGLNQGPVQTARFLWGNPGDSHLTTSVVPHSIIITASLLSGQNALPFLPIGECVCDVRLCGHVVVIWYWHPLGVAQGDVFLRRWADFCPLSRRKNFFRATLMHKQSQSQTPTPSTTKQTPRRRFGLRERLPMFDRDCYILFSWMTWLSTRMFMVPETLSC